MHQASAQGKRKSPGRFCLLTFVLIGGTEKQRAQRFIGLINEFLSAEVDRQSKREIHGDKILLEMSPVVSLSVIVSILLSALSALKYTRAPLFNAESAKILRALCVPSALFALQHTRALRFNAKAAKGPLNQVVFSDTEALRMLKFERSEVCG